jgi:septum formation inhibitor-activating ATPase MinD
VAGVISLPTDREVVLALCEQKSTHKAKRVCVTSQTGGAGASTFAGALAGNLASLGHRVLMLDATNRNQRLDLTYGLSERPANLLEALASCSANDLVRMLPIMDEVHLEISLSSHPQQLAGFVDVIEAHFDYLVFDAGQKSANLCADLELRMTTNTIAAAALTRDGNNSTDHELALIVRMLPGAGLSAIDLAEHTKIPLWATVPTNQAIVEHVEQGLGVTNLYRTSLRKPLEAVLERLDFAQESSLAA